MSEKNELSDKALAEAGFKVIPEAVPKKAPKRKIAFTLPTVKLAEPKPELKKQLPTDLVNVQVVIGTMACEEGIFEHDQIFQVTRNRAEHFGSAVKIL
jgi:hypothetical protein